VYEDPQPCGMLGPCTVAKTRT